MALFLSFPLALGVAWAALRSPIQVPPFAQAAPQPCQPGRLVADGVTLRRTPQGAGSQGAASQGAEADFWSSGVLRLSVCGPGTLSFSASGTPAAGQDARLTVALGSVPLLETPARQPQGFRLRVNGPGWLTLAFPNDLDAPPEDRNLFLRGLKFTPD